MQNNKIINLGYITAIVLIILNIFMFFDAIDSFRYAPMGMWLVFLIDVPLGIILFFLSFFIKKKDHNKTTLKNIIVNSGFVLGVLLPVISIILFSMVNKNYL